MQTNQRVPDDNRPLVYRATVVISAGRGNRIDQKPQPVLRHASTEVPPDPDPIEGTLTKHEVTGRSEAEVARKISRILAIEYPQDGAQ